MSKIKAAMIHDGYVESNHIAGVPVHHEVGFGSVEEYLGHLGKTVLDAYLKGFARHRWSKCCREAQGKGDAYCPKCGTHLKEPSLSEERGIDLMQNFLHGSCDSLGSIWEEVENAGWSFGPQAFEEMQNEEPVLHVFEYGAESLWYCAQGQVEELMTDKTSYGQVLGDHVKLLGPEIDPEAPVYKKAQDGRT